MFKRIIDRIFRNVPNTHACIDGYIIIGRGTFEEHLKIIKEVLCHLTEIGMQVNMERCT